MSPLHLIEEPPPPPAPQFALWALGFRPFYLLASVFAALSVPLWALQFSGLLPQPYLAGPVWHAHEMLFGFALAVIVGFLFTAGRNWTNEPTPTGKSLVLLAGLWVMARVLVLTPWGVAAALVNVAFPLAAAGALAGPFLKARNQRNYFFIALLAGMAAASGFVHLAQLGVLQVPAWAGLQLALDMVLFILVVMGGRVIPMFTNNGVPGAQARRVPWLDKASLGLVLALGALDLLGVRGGLLAVMALAAAAAHGARWALWQPWKTLKVPLVWVLQVAYLWIVVHLVLRSTTELGWTGASTATHALTVGAIGGLIIGMVTRTARGHTARPLRADGFDTACYALVLTSALVRVGLPLLWPATTLLAVQASAVLWAAGFGLYAFRYWPVLSRARLDGKPG